MATGSPPPTRPPGRQHVTPMRGSAPAARRARPGRKASRWSAGHSRLDRHRMELAGAPTPRRLTANPGQNIHLSGDATHIRRRRLFCSSAVPRMRSSRSPALGARPSRQGPRRGWTCSPLSSRSNTASPTSSWGGCPCGHTAGKPKPRDRETHSRCQGEHTRAAASETAQNLQICTRGGERSHNQSHVQNGGDVRVERLTSQLQNASVMASWSA